VTGPSSRAIALAAAGGLLVACAGVYAGLTVTHRNPASEQVAVDIFSPPTPFTPPETMTETVSVPATTTSPPPSTSDQLSNFVRVNGPNGMTTYLPASWPTKVAPGPAAMQADDPTGTGRFLRYGGSATAVSDSYQIHVDYQRQFSANKQAFVSLRLERTTVRGYSAIDWEFEFDVPEGRRHARSIYWLASGYEYFVYASAPAQLWSPTQEILDVMLDKATP
jgi:hypothetical protein